jgi:hypothetical protein
MPRSVQVRVRFAPLRLRSRSSIRVEDSRPAEGATIITPAQLPPSSARPARERTSPFRDGDAHRLHHVRDHLPRRAAGVALGARPRVHGDRVHAFALRHLGGITGRVHVEDLLDTIFKDFCIGK